MKGGYARVKANQALIAESRICRVGPHRSSNPKIKHSTQKNEPCVGSSSRKTKNGTPKNESCIDSRVSNSKKGGIGVTIGAGALRGPPQGVDRDHRAGVDIGG